MMSMHPVRMWTFSSKNFPGFTFFICNKNMLGAFLAQNCILNVILLVQKLAGQLRKISRLTQCIIIIALKLHLPPCGPWCSFGLVSSCLCSLMIAIHVSIDFSKTGLQAGSSPSKRPATTLTIASLSMSSFAKTLAASKKQSVGH